MTNVKFHYIFLDAFSTNRLIKYFFASTTFLVFREKKRKKKIEGSYEIGRKKSNLVDTRFRVRANRKEDERWEKCVGGKKEKMTRLGCSVDLKRVVPVPSTALK